MSERSTWTDERMDDVVAHINARFDQVDARFAEMGRRFDRIESRLDRLSDHLTTGVWVIAGVLVAQLVGFMITQA